MCNLCTPPLVFPYPVSPDRQAGLNSCFTNFPNLNISGSGDLIFFLSRFPERFHNLSTFRAKDATKEVSLQSQT